MPTLIKNGAVATDDWATGAELRPVKPRCCRRMPGEQR